MAIITRLPRGISGVVFRHDGTPGRAALARRISLLCRARRITLVIAGDWRMAATCRAGLHLRGGAAPRTRYRGPITTASAHDRAQIVAATRAGVTIAFLSPAFATASHPGERPLDAVRWAGLAQACKTPVLALGGVAGRAPLRLATICAGFGAIGALS